MSTAFATMQIEEASTSTRTTVGQLWKRPFVSLFCLHFFLIASFAIYLTTEAIIFVSQSHRLRPSKWYPPMLASTACAATVAFIWQWVTASNPTKAIKAAFWLGPLLTCAVGILLVYIDSAASLGLGVIVLVSAFIQSLYGLWVRRRFGYAASVISVSIEFPPAKTGFLVCSSIVVSSVYSCILLSGIGGATASKRKLYALFILIILVSQAWTMHVLRNIVQVTISRVKYLHFSGGTNIGTKMAFCDTIKYSMGSVCIGSILTPILGLIRGLARAINLVSGDGNEFLFSCAHCYSGIASVLITYGNRWGFVHVGVYNKGFVRASRDTWELFGRVGLKDLIDSDLTGSFCFLCGMVGGALSSLVSGIWSIVDQRNYAFEVSIYSFLVGYFMSRLAMSWIQASVSAYYVAYAENPQSARIDPTIPVRLEQIHRYQAQQSA